jgi:hypothetical protein
VRYQIKTNDAGEVCSSWIDSAEAASSLCATMNLGAYHRGQGGLYGVYDETGERVP